MNLYFLQSNVFFNLMAFTIFNNNYSTENKNEEIDSILIASSTVFRKVIPWKIIFWNKLDIKVQFSVFIFILMRYYIQLRMIELLNYGNSI